MINMDIIYQWFELNFGCTDINRAISGAGGDKTAPLSAMKGAMGMSLPGGGFGGQQQGMGGGQMGVMGAMGMNMNPNIMGLAPNAMSNNGQTMDEQMLQM